MDVAVQTAPAEHPVHYERHRPERTLLYQLVQEYYPAFQAHLAAQGTGLPRYVEKEFEDYLQCGRLESGFLRVRCDSCHDERLVGFSCKRRGFCPSCGARRMAESAALLVDDVFPDQPVRQWVLSFPYPLRFLFATQPAIMEKVLGIVYRVIATHLIKKGRLHMQDGAHRRRDTDPTFRQRAQCKHPLPNAVPRRAYVERRDIRFDFVA